ncbi:LamG-like jellyroll fold domain-containing protein [Nonomuraea typhae]|uniref:LamG-like jellyroll fold domain-containing protein n=1 Tax=Nonomuraea typhae TaxID=2603600 RepID=A0ABW7ZES3_9ACTN
MNTRRLSSGPSTRTRRRAALIAALALPLSLLSAPATAQGPTPSPSSAPADPVIKTAWDKAAASGKPVEVPSKFTETMKVWANPDGKTMRAELHTEPVQLKNPDGGAWEPVDTRVVTRDSKLQAVRVKTPLTFGARGSKRLVLAGGKIGLSVTRALPEPQVSGNAVTYPDAVAPGADLVVQAQADGFVSQVVFRQRPSGSVTVRLPLTLPEGTTFGRTPQGLPQLKNAKGEPEAAPVVLTATDAMVEAAPGQGRTSSVKARVETSGKTPELVFTPDEKFLADSAVTYPVTIAAASEYFGGGAPEDAWVSRNDPYNNNASAGYLRAGTTSTSADVARVYMRFDVEDPVLEGATVVDADLRMWNYKSGGPGGQLCGEVLGAGIVAARVTQDWDLDTLDWYTQPASTGVEGLNKAGYNYDADPASWCAKDDELFYRVTNMARAWVEQGVPNHGVVLRAASESAAINWRQYYSSQFGGGQPYPGYRHPPALMIEYIPRVKEHKIVLRTYPGDQEPPAASYADDQAWVAAGNVHYDSLPPSRVMTDDEALAGAVATNSSAKTSLAEAYYPEGLTDSELIEGIDTEPEAPPEEPEPGTNPPPEEDTTPPSVTSASPAGGQVDVPTTTSVVAVFSERVTDAAVTVKNPQGAEVAGNAVLDASHEVLTFTPDAALAGDTAYTVEVSGAKDIAENVMTPRTWSFTTAAPDTAPPVVSGTSPAADATGVPVDAPVRATFSEKVSDAQITVKNAQGAAAAGTSAMDVEGKVLTFAPQQRLAGTTVYTAEVSGAKDTSGNVMAAPHIWSFTTGADAPQPVPGLVAAYGMNEGTGTGVSDSSGQGNAGTSSGTAWVNGKYGKALSFNGTSSWVTVQDAASLRLTTGMTLSAWVSPASVAGWRSMVGKELNTGGVSYTLYAANGDSVPSGWVQTGPQAPTTVEDLEPLPVNAWSHVALTYDGSALRLFVNGQQTGEAALTGSLYDDGGPLRIGGNQIWQEYFSGLIDEVRVYNRAQTAAQIQTDMNTPVGQEPVQDTQAPSAPGSLAATGGSRNAQLTWTASTDNVGVSGYSIHRSATPQFTPSAANVVGSSTTTTFTDAGLAAGTYHYRVRASDAAGNLSPSSNEVSATVTAPPAIPGLVAAYGMEEGSGTIVGDSSGQNNIGTTTDSTWAVAGRHGKALSFNGASSWVTVPHAPSLRLTNTLTLSAWVRPSTVDDLWRAVLMKERSSGGGYGLYASTEYSAPAGWLETSVEGGGLTGNDPLPLNQWTHLATTYDGSTFRLYINGAQVAQAPLTGEVRDDGGSMRIGGNAFWGEFYSGLIDEVRVYDRVQTAAEIQADMNKPVGAAATPGHQRVNIATNSAPKIARLTVDDARTADGLAVASTLTPRLTTWLPAGRRGEAKVDVEVARTPPAKTGAKIGKTDKPGADQRPIWSGRATAGPGDAQATVRVPRDRLRAGSKVRWRARVTTGGVTGDWSGWQPIMVDRNPQVTARAAASDPPTTPDDLKNTLPTGAEQPKWATVQDCYREAGRASSGGVYAPNRFSHCRLTRFVVNVWEGTPGSSSAVLKGQLHGFQMMHTGTRVSQRILQVDKRISLLPNQSWGYQPKRVAFGWEVLSTEPAGQNPTICDRRSASGMLGMHTIAEWATASAQQPGWHMTETYADRGREGYHKLGRCTVNSYARGESPFDKGPREFSSTIGLPSFVRCDASPNIGWHNKNGGGCVHMNAVAKMVMRPDDVNPRGVGFSDLFYHVSMAFNLPDQTYPLAGGKSFPDTEGERKNIPGKSIASRLTRAAFKATREANYAATARVCKNEVPIEDQNKKSCDEFPFESTYQGAARANPEHNFSVTRINGTMNKQHGNVLKAWYWNNRIINKDGFYIELK